MEISTPVRKSHTSTVDLLTWSEIPLSYSPSIASIACSHQDPKLLVALVESRKRQAPYAGAFLLKDEPGTDPSVVSGSDTDKNMYVLKGKELFNRLNEVGTLAQITRIQGGQVVFIGHRRLRITELTRNAISETYLASQRFASSVALLVGDPTAMRDHEMFVLEDTAGSTVA